MYFSLMMTH